MPKETIGDIEVAWSRYSSKKEIELRVPKIMMDSDGSSYGSLRLKMDLGFATQLAKVLQKAVRQIEDTQGMEDFSDLPAVDVDQVAQIVKGLRKEIVVDDSQMAVRLAELVEQGNLIRKERADKATQDD